MFGFLKDKLKKAVKSISEKFEKKELEAEKPEVVEKVEEIKPIEVEPVVEETRKEEVVEEEVFEEKEVEEIPAEEKVEERVSEVEREAEFIEPEAEVKPEPELKPEIKEVEEAEEIKEVVEKPKEKEKKGFFKRIAEKIVKKVVEKKLDAADVEPILDDLVSGMIEADVAYEVAEKIKSDLHASLVDRPIRRGKENEVVVDALRQSLLDVLTVQEIDLENLAKSKKPVLLVFLGFNGSGKTTSLAKVAKWLIDRGYSCVFAAADTFRAAAEEQLEIHADRLGVKIIKHKHGADPAAVIFDAIEHAKANNIDFVLADTAGRAHTNTNLMDQMKKIVRVNKPDLKILVMDSLVGNDAVPQAQLFGDVGVDGVIFTKVDVNEKGGAILSVTHQLKKPILFLGLGQKYEDFEKFDREKFVQNILS
jgi:fused signal recognition particle receptor